MPPRFSYWTIIIDGQPTAFRAAELDEISPTFTQIKAKQPLAVLKWFQNGRLWDSPVAAREAIRQRGEQGRRAPHGAAKPNRPGARPKWSPAAEGTPARPAPERPKWNPRGSSAHGRDERGPAARERAPRDNRRAPATGRPEWQPPGARHGDRQQRAPDTRTRAPRAERPKPGGAHLEWTPKGAVPSGRSERSSSEWRPAPKTERSKRSGDRLEWTPKGEAPARRTGRPEWAPKGKPSAREDERPKWKPKSETAEPPPRAPGAPADKRDRSWRPGGDHKDPRQKYKDAKKAKWTRFKQAIRGRRKPKP